VSRAVDGESQSKNIGNYELLAKLGEGGMSRVYKAKHLKTGQTVAVKILRSTLSRSRKLVEDFYREARAVAALNHPNLPRVYDVGEDEGRHYIAMEFITGATLQKVIEKQGAVPEAGALTIAHHVAEVLKYAWEKEKIIHRDIKPENLMVLPDRSLKLMDMGLAKAHGDDAATAGEGGGIIGTPMYASPEQIRGEKDLDCRSDIYSLGMTLYHAVTGALPYEGATSALIMAKQLNEELPDPRRRNPSLSLNLVMLLKKMTEKKREARYQSPDELLQALESCRNRLIQRQARAQEEQEEARRGLFFR
jgi:serine/threonine-protein kinase